RRVLFRSPGRLVVLARFFVVAGIQAVFEVEVFPNNVGKVGVIAHILVLHLVVFQQVADDPAQEHDVGAGSDGRVEVGHGRGTGEARTDRDQLRLVVRLGFSNPLKPARGALGGFAAQDRYYTGVVVAAP